MSQNATHQPSVPPKNRTTAALLALFLGIFGVHQFYLGNTLSGIIRIVVTLTIYGALVSFLLAIVEVVMYLTISDEQFHEDYVARKKAFPWSTPSMREPSAPISYVAAAPSSGVAGEPSSGVSDPSSRGVAGEPSGGVAGPPGSYVPHPPSKSNTNKKLVIGAIVGVVLVLFIGCIAMFASTVSEVDEDLDRMDRQIDRAQDQFDRALDQNDRAQDQFDKMLDDLE